MIYRYNNTYKWNYTSGAYTIEKYPHIRIREKVSYHRPWGYVIGETKGRDLSSDKYTYYHKEWDIELKFSMTVTLDCNGKYAYSISYKPYVIRYDALEHVLDDFDFLGENWLFNNL